MKNFARLEIDLGELAENVRRLRRMIPPRVVFMAVIKADAYGHGAVPVARTVLAAGADRLGVAFAGEGVELRRNGVDSPIMVLGAMHPGQAGELVEHRLTPCLGDMETARALNREASRRGRPFPVHVEVDTGLHRLGFPAQSAVEISGDIQALGHLTIEGVSTHMARADEGVMQENERQFELFLRLLEEMKGRGIKPRLRHVAASSLVIDRPDMSLDMVRCGISLFGYAPRPHQAAAAGIRPVMSFKTRLAQVRTVPAGEGVGYDHRFRTNRVSVIGTIPTGYVDGLPYGLDRGGQVLVRRRRVPICGKGCMDHTLIDLTDVPDVAPWDEVVLLGRQGDQAIWGDEWAVLSGRSVEDVLCGLTRKRVDRSYRRPAGDGQSQHGWDTITSVGS